MKKWFVTGEITISVHVEVEAETEEEAMELAADAPMQTFCNQCSRGDSGEWSTCGELDGEVTVTHAESE